MQRSIGPKDTEVVPNLHDTYIVILTQHHVYKLLPATDANISMVNEMIAKLPAKSD